MIIRIATRPRYTIVANGTLEDKRLSWEAIGMLSYLLSKPNNWRINREHLAAERRAGKDKVARILGELSEAGYLIRRQFRNEDGMFQWENVLYEVSQNTDSPLPENPSSGFTAPGFAPLVKTESVKTDQQLQDYMARLREGRENGTGSTLESPGKPTVEEQWHEALWLLEFLRNGQHTFNSGHQEKLLNHDFWADLAESLGPLDETFLRKEFAKMSIWIRDNSRRAPKPRGVRKFVTNWLERANEDRR